MKLRDSKFGKSQRGGGHVSRDFEGAGKTYYREQKVDSAGLCPFPLRKTTGREQMGGWGGNVSSVGGVGPKPFWGRAFYGMFSPPLSFPAPISRFEVIFLP